MSRSFEHSDSQRKVLFGPRAIERGEADLGKGYTLLTTARAASVSPPVLAGARAVIEVRSGPVSEVAGELRDEVRGVKLVALGGGRVIDVAKALAAADPPRTLLAIPTTLSGAEMTGMHRLPLGLCLQTPRVRPQVVLNDPELSASAPVEQLAASSANALAHALVAIASERATPLSDAIAREAVFKIARAWHDTWPERPQLALGALLAGWAVDHTGLGLHHVLAQTAVRSAGLGHAQANVALLPVSIGALRARAAPAFQRLEAELGGELETVALGLRERAGVAGVGVLAEDQQLLAEAVQEALARPELASLAHPPDQEELKALYLAAR